MKHILLTLLAVMATLTVAAQSNRFYIEDFELDRDSVISVPVMLANETAMRGFQFDISLPEGMELDESSLTKYSKGFDMHLVCRSLPAGGYIVFVFPKSATCYSPATAAVLTLTFSAGPDFKGGDVILRECKGSTMENKSFTINGGTTHVTVPATSLIGIPMDQTQDQNKYF